MAMIDKCQMSSATLELSQKGNSIILKCQDIWYYTKMHRKYAHIIERLLVLILCAN